VNKQVKFKYVFNDPKLLCTYNIEYSQIRHQGGEKISRALAVYRNVDMALTA